MAEYLDYTGLSHFKDKLDDAYAEKSHTHDNYAPSVTGGYLPLSGGTMTGTITTKGSLYDRISQNTTAATPTGGGIDMNNSDITRANAIIWADQASVKEGLMFPSSNFVTWDSIWANGVGEIHADSYNKTTGATTVRYIPKSDAVSKGDASTPLYLSNGFLSPCTSIKTTLLTQSGMRIAGGLDLLTTPLVPTATSCKSFGLPADAITIEYSNDGGTTWTDYGATDAQKRGLFMGTRSASFVCGKKTTAGTQTTNDQLRITIKPTDRYVTFESIYCWMSTSGNTCVMDLECSTIGDKENFSTKLLDGVSLAGWSGHNIDVFGQRTFGGGSNQTTNTYAYRITFRMTAVTASYAAMSVNDIRFFGKNLYSCSSTTAKGMLYYNTLYELDNDFGAKFPATVTAPNFSGKFTGGLACYPSARPTSANTRYGDGLLRYYLATTSMTTGKPPSDAMILHMGWDNTGGYDSQLAIGTGANNKLYYRNMNGGSTWNSWKTVATTDDIPTLPTLATVATSGSYNDLTDKPTIPSSTDVAITNAEIDSIVNGTYS